MTARGLRFFVDSADPAIWRKYAKQGWLHGATTNPLILERAGLAVTIDNAQMFASAAREIGLLELQFQSWGEETDQLIENGQAIAALWENMTVKIPATRNGFEAAGELKRSNISITLTACYTAHQTALAATMNLDYVAPYYGRMLEAGIDADSRLDAMLKVSEQYPQLRILVASIRNIAQLETLLARGFDTFTITPDLCALIGLDEDTEKAAADFENAARNSLKHQG